MVARFVFLSGPKCGDVGQVDMFGLTFPRGVPVEVADARSVRKLRGNQFFREEAEDAPRRGRAAKLAESEDKLAESEG